VWNLARFAETLLPLLHENEKKEIELAEEELSRFSDLYKQYSLAGMRAKLGLFHEEEQDQSLVEDLLSMMHKYQADYTNTFRAFTLGKPEDTVMYGTAEFTEWNERWQARLASQQESKAAAQQLMQSSNPAIIPRNHRVEEALEAAVNQGDYRVMERLLDVLSDPFAYSPEQEEYATLPADSNCAYRTYCGT